MIECKFAPATNSITLARGRTHHTTKAEVFVAIRGTVVKADRRQQIEAVAVAPRGTPQHSVGACGLIQILAPLPHVAAQVSNAISVGLKTPHGGCRCISIQITPVSFL